MQILTFGIAHIPEDPIRRQFYFIADILKTIREGGGD
jgi:hypothetical protein